MARVITEVALDRVQARLAEVRDQIDAAARRAGRDPDGVELLVAAKYVPAGELETLAAAGIELIGHNRAQDLIAGVDAYGERFTWDFIGHLQSRKVKQVLPRVRLIHSVASDSVLEQLERHATPETEVLVQVNVSGEAGKDGVAPHELGAFIERCPVTVVGLMTLPPPAARPDDSRPYFARLRELADSHGLERLSMGTSQDYTAAVEEGATIVRLGSVLFD